MWLEECDSFAELCRGYLPYYLLIILPIFIIISPVNPVAASHEFPVYRMHEYDLHGEPHGTEISAFYSVRFRTRRAEHYSYDKFEFYDQVVAVLQFLWRPGPSLDGAPPDTAS